MKKDRRERVESEGLLVDERARLVQLEQNAELRMERDVIKRGCPMGQGGDSMTVASFIAAQRIDHGVPHAKYCRWLGRAAVDVLYVAGTARGLRPSNVGLSWT